MVLWVQWVSKRTNKAVCSSVVISSSVFSRGVNTVAKVVVGQWYTSIKGAY